MNWQTEGILLSKTKFRENANIINVFTNKYGKVSGIVYGGNSRKIRNYLQLSNKIFIFYTSKRENKLGYFKTELVEPIAPKYFNDKKKTSALLSIVALLNSLLPEFQPYKNLYLSINNLIKNFNQDNWIILYIIWEINLIKELGFDPNLDKFDVDDNLSEIIEIDNIKYTVPKFLLAKRFDKIKDLSIKKALIFTRSLIQNKFFLPNNLIFPRSRVHLENYFN
ncbi:MAG: DNA repair protein RecO [Candidatus Pelagibacter sp. TMED165]|nr:MAG: DNA repair protein RecO [Candidatus Pelagibacter sp. TMED165]